jgi:hypothetical protein
MKSDNIINVIILPISVKYGVIQTGDVA